MSSYFRLGLFPLLKRGNIPGYEQLQIKADHRIGDPCWGYQKVRVEISFSLPIFGWFPCDKGVDKHINWIRAAYNLPPIEEDLPF